MNITTIHKNFVSHTPYTFLPCDLFLTSTAFSTPLVRSHIVVVVSAILLPASMNVGGGYLIVEVHWATNRILLTFGSTRIRLIAQILIYWSPRNKSNIGLTWCQDLFKYKFTD